MNSSTSSCISGPWPRISGFSSLSPPPIYSHMLSLKINKQTF